MREFLYHGTTEGAVKAILRDGIMPRRSARPSTWGTVPSAPDRVYLAEGYAPYFAAAAAAEGERHALVEVKLAALDERLLRPDEDFIAQVLKRQEPGCREMCWADLNRMVLSLGRWDGLWKESLQALGTCAYAETIPTEAISRVALYDPADNPQMAMAVLDPAISVLNWQLCAEKYRLITRWHMGDELTLEEWLEPGLRSLLGEKHVSQITAALKRQRIEVRG